MDLYSIGAIITVGILSGTIVFLTTRFSANKKIVEYNTLAEAIRETSEKLANIQSQVINAEKQYERINEETIELQDLKANSDQLEEALTTNSDLLNNAISELDEKETELDSLDSVVTRY